MSRGLVALVFAATVAVLASGTHALHWPEMLVGIHESRHPGDRMAAPATAVYAAATESAHEVWCSIVALAPMAATAVALQIAATVLLLVVPRAQPVRLPDSRVRAPPLHGARLRATLQVFRN